MGQERRAICYAEKLYFSYTALVRVTLAITSRGVMTLPIKLREAVGLRPEDPIIAETTPEGLLLRPAVTLPVEIYSDQRVREFDKAEADLAKILPRHSPQKRGR